MKFRLFALPFFFIALYSLLILNIYNLQIRKGIYYTARAASQSQVLNESDSVRGNIYFSDRNNNLVPAAMSKKYPLIFAIPKEISAPEETAVKLAGILGLDKDKLVGLLSKPKDPYEPILHKATQEQADAVKQAQLPGIYVDEEMLRFYPFNDLASQVLGFVGPTAQNSQLSGRYGVESYFDKQLSGQEDVNLTLDPNIQTRAEEVLRNLIQSYSADGGSVIVADPKTGKILAMGSYPTFDANNYSQSSLETFLNPAVQGIYEPGSIIKVLTMSAGIDSNKITPDTTFVDTGSVTLNGYTIKNWDHQGHGKITMTQVIEKSVNTGAVFAERQMGREILSKYFSLFGLDKPTGIQLPGEVSGDLKNLQQTSREINAATASFGQGIAITPIELISAISAIANGGLLMKPYITADSQPEVIQRVISEDTARKVTAMMVSAVAKAQIAQISQYDVAGKTGTAQIPDPQRGGYENNVYIHTYVGFAPASDPKFIILLKLDKPKATLAGTTVVPAFRDLAEFILNYYNIPPDHLNASQ